VQPTGSHCILDSIDTDQIDRYIFISLCKLSFMSLVNYRLSICMSSCKVLKKMAITRCCKMLLFSALLLLIGSTLAENNDEKKRLDKRCRASYKYRMEDGTCNNLRNPLLGASFTPYGRIYGINSANYSDGILNIFL
jgi:hypothetical protein